MLLGARLLSAVVLCVSVSACSEGAPVAPHPLVPQSFKTATAFYAAPMLIITHPARGTTFNKAPTRTSAATSVLAKYDTAQPGWDAQTAALITRTHTTHMTVAHAMEPSHHARRHRHDHNRGYGARL